jgi:hypothetical protein
MDIKCPPNALGIFTGLYILSNMPKISSKLSYKIFYVMDFNKALAQQKSL